jgi:hypothetical protein
MGYNLKFLAVLDGCGLAGTYLLGTVSLDRDSLDLSYLRSEPLCNGGSMVSKAAYYSEMSRANDRMRAAMQIVRSGDTDRDFAGMMIAHHQGATWPFCS